MFHSVPRLPPSFYTLRGLFFFSHPIYIDREHFKWRLYVLECYFGFISACIYLPDLSADISDNQNHRDIFLITFNLIGNGNHCRKNDCRPAHGSGTAPPAGISFPAICIIVFHSSCIFQTFYDCRKKIV